MWILCALIAQLALYGIQSLKIHITVDNKTVFKYGPSERQSRDSDLNITKSSNDFSGIKFKREVPTESLTGVDENGPCKWRSDNHGGESMESKTFHQALVADQHSRVMLTCHYCNDSDAVVYGSILWYRVSRGILSQVNITEVEPDMNDDENQNRVVISPAHALTFKSVRTADAGGYFCRSEKNPAILDSIDLQTNASVLMDLITVPGQISFFYHLDVLPPIGLRVIHVSSYGHGRPKPQGKVILGSRNVIFFTDWQEWTRCSTCGHVGERKRYGVRMMAKSDPNLAADPWFLNKVLSTFTKGVPSRSTLLREVKGLPEALDEIETEFCDVACHRTWIYSDDDKIEATVTNEQWRDLTFDTKHKVIKKVFTATEGDVFKMKCPGSAVDSMVWWKNGTESVNSFTISEQSRGRVHIDVLNNLVINTITSYDTGKYSCWINGNLWALMKLHVHAPPMKRLEGVWYHAPYFCTVVSFHFWVFLATLLLRHAYRQVSPTDGRRQSETGGKEEDAQERCGRGGRFWDGNWRWNEGEGQSKEKRLEKYGEKYGDSLSRKMVSGGACYVGGGEDGEEGEERRSLIGPWMDVQMAEEDEMDGRN